MTLNPPIDVITGACARAVDALVTGAVTLRGLGGAVEAVTWPTWERSNGRPIRVRGRLPSLYEGDAGIAFALRELGRALERSDALELADASIRTLPTEVPDAVNLAHPLGPVESTADHSILGGSAGIGLASGKAPRSIAAGVDLASGAAGTLLLTDDLKVARAALTQVVRAAEKQPVGSCWPEVGEPALCGLAHGASGIALGLAEAAGRFGGRDPMFAKTALQTAGEALRWEASWFDALRGGWPDLRQGFSKGEIPSYPDLWCHGSAGIALVRLRLLELIEAGVIPEEGFGLPVESIQADAEAAVGACGRALATVTKVIPEYGWRATSGGLTLCHGLGGPLEVLIEASRIWQTPSHLEVAREFSCTLIDALPEDPWSWPDGMVSGSSQAWDEREGGLGIVDSEAPLGVAGLFVGIAGTALTLGRLACPEAKLNSAAMLALAPMASA